MTQQSALTARRSPVALFVALRRRPAASVIILVLAYLVILPLVVLAVVSVKPTGLASDPGFTLRHYSDVFGSARTYRLLLNTVIFGGSSTVLAVMFGTGFAWLIERTDIPAARWFRTVMILPMAMPPVLLALAWALLLSPSVGVINTTLHALFGPDVWTMNIYSMPGMIWVESIALTPTAFLLMAPNMRNMDPSLEDAATTAGASQFTVFRRITLPMMRPNLIASCIYLFIISLLVFDIPGLIGMRGKEFVLSSEIYYELSGTGGTPDYGFIGALALIPIVILLPLTVIYQKLLSKGHRFVTITSRGYRARKLPLGRWRRYFATIPLLFFLLIGIALPLLVLLLTSLMPFYTAISNDIWSTLTWSNFETVLNSRKAQRGAANSGIIAFIVATALAIGAPIIAHQVVRRKGVAGSIIDRISFIPVAFSHMMISVALVFVYLSIRVLPLYGTIWIIAIAHITSYLAFSTRSMNGSLLQIDSDLESAARVSGAGVAKTMRKITYPLLKPTILVVWLWVFAHSLRDISSSIILVARDNGTLPTELWSMWQGGDATGAAALGVCLIAVLAVIALVWDRIGGKKGA